ncbi:tetratricopeptide repeat protein [Paenibacillus gorillae]|uniref:tetratricopeptide repeat protein n=1 Tax=Paenibacillus gorillae TaxID=1243662 RepID=UPI0004ADACC1|nr:tetratricopeptide repeat protein [Paenibacillus gorillae]
MFNKALNSINSIYGIKHPSTCKTYSNLGLAYMENKNYYLARDYFKKAFELSETIYSEAHPEQANYLNNLGWSYEALDELDEAEKILLRAIKMTKESSKTEPNLALASRYNNLGMVYYKKGRKGDKHFYTLAKQYYEKGIQIDEWYYGDNHLELTADYNNYAALLEEIGESLQAISYYNKALKIFNISNDSHPRSGYCYFMVGFLYYKLRNFTLSRQNLIKSISVFSRYPQDLEAKRNLKHAQTLLKMLPS